MELEFSEHAPIVFAVLSFILGAMVGSFLNVCVYRLPRNLSVVRPRSKCPTCENPIAWYDNIPLMSWLVLGAKCRHCGQPISWQYPMVEALTGSLFLLVFLKFGLVLATPIYMALVAALVLVTFVDLTDWTIPDEVTFPGMAAGLACSLLGMVYPASALLETDPLDALIGLAVGGGILYALDQLALLLLKKPGMGFGDVKLLAMLGAFLGWKGVLVSMVFASFVGCAVGLSIMFRKRGQGEKLSGHYIPFGPYLVAGSLVHLFFGPEIIQTYLDYLQVPGPI